MSVVLFDVRYQPKKSNAPMLVDDAAEHPTRTCIPPKCRRDNSGFSASLFIKVQTQVTVVVYAVMSNPSLMVRKPAKVPRMPRTLTLVRVTPQTTRPHEVRISMKIGDCAAGQKPSLRPSIYGFRLCPPLEQTSRLASYVLPHSLFTHPSTELPAWPHHDGIHNQNPSHNSLHFPL